MLLMESLESQPVSFTDTKDPLLSKVRQLVTDGWPDVVDSQELKPFAEMSHELSVECGCLLRGNRVVVPASLRKQVVSLLHDGHPGVVKMKAMYGGPVLTRPWNGMCRACHARKTANHLKQPLCTLGNGQ